MGVSVIIPTLNEERCLAATLSNLRQQQPREIIIADGGSTDRTVQIAGDADIVVQGLRGRAMQMNQGAARATGDALLFLHADCSLEDGALRAVESCLQRRGVVAGCFQMHVAAAGALYRWIDYVAGIRVRCARIIYGDQGLFLRSDLFEQLGGFPPLGLMEDVYFSRALGRHGRLVIAPRRICVSPRRWQRAGIIRQTARNWILLGLAVGGVHPDRLAKWYPAVR